VPGSGTHWVKRGAHLGHFIVEKVEPGKIVYRDGDRLSELAVNTELPVHAGQIPETTVASDKRSTSPPKPSGPDKPRKTRERGPMHRLGPVRPETPLVARNDRSING
jgi:hypothetical protein